MVSGCGVSPADGKLQVFFTGNVRGNLTPCGCRISKGGVARLASFVERYHVKDANLLLVDAGNFVDRESGRQGCSEKCRLMLASTELLGYDALNVATQELSLGLAALTALRDTADGTPLISANVVDAKSGDLIFEPYIIRTYGNMTIGIIGLISESAILSPTVLDGGALRINSACEAAARYVPELAKRVNAIVLIGELADNDVAEILKANPTVDLVINSGRQLKTEVMRRVGATRVLGTGISGYNGHYVDIEFRSVWNDSFAFRDHMDALTDKYEQPNWLTDKFEALGISKLPPSAEDLN